MEYTDVKSVGKYAQWLMSASVIVINYILDYYKRNDGMRGFVSVLFF